MFLLTGAFSTAAIASLKAAGDATALEVRFGGEVAQLGGRIVHLLFVAGDIRFLAIIDMPRATVQALVLRLAGGDLVAEGTLRLNRVRENPADIDAELASAAMLGQPWPSAGGA